MSESESDEKNMAKDVDCFVIMPFSDQPGYECGHFTRVYEDIILPSCKNAGVNAFRGDTTNKPNVIHVDIVQKLIKSQLAICDLSSRNPNVMFELGIRQAFCLPTVLISDLITPDIFDVAPIRCMKYDSALRYHDVLQDQMRLASVIKETIESKVPIVNSILSLAGLPHAELPSEIKDNGEIVKLFQKIMMKLDSTTVNPFPYAESFAFPVSGLSCDVMSGCALPTDRMSVKE